MAYQREKKDTEKKDRHSLLFPNSKPYQAVSLADLEFSKVYLPLAPVWKNACPVSRLSSLLHPAWSLMRCYFSLGLDGEKGQA
jgi:hypothetical protein